MAFVFSRATFSTPTENIRDFLNEEKISREQKTGNSEPEAGRRKQKLEAGNSGQGAGSNRARMSPGQLGISTNLIGS